MRVGHVRDEADSGGEEAGILLGAVDGPGEIGIEAPADRRDVDADFFEDLALHQAAHPAAARRAVLVLPLPFGKGEARLASRVPFDRFELGADAVAQRLEPLARSEEHTSELQSLMRISYAVFCL